LNSLVQEPLVLEQGSRNLPQMAGRNFALQNCCSPMQPGLVATLRVALGIAGDRFAYTTRTKLLRNFSGLLSRPFKKSGGMYAIWVVSPREAPRNDAKSVNRYYFRISSKYKCETCQHTWMAEKTSAICLQNREYSAIFISMNASERFYRALDKMAGRGQGLEVTVQAVRSAFAQAVGKIPEELQEAVFLRFLDRFGRSGKPEETFAEAAYSLGPYIDLFWMNYREEETPAEGGGKIPAKGFDPGGSLCPEDWKFLREEVSASAESLDLDILTYIMRQIMEHGAL
jgi:hypothetical protein